MLFKPQKCQIIWNRGDNKNVKKTLPTDVSLDYGIFKLARNNVRLIRNWQSLARSLGLHKEVVNIQRRVNMDMEDQEQCVVHLLESWQALRPKEATVLNLVRHLRLEEFNDVAGKFAGSIL